MKKCIVIPDSFKGTLSSLEICEIAKRCFAKILPNVELITLPIADGGEGTVVCFIHAIAAQAVTVSVSGPYGESVERACECIVTFARLRWGLVKVNHNCEACHEEEPEDNPELLDASLAGISLPQQADDAQDERQQIDHVMALIACAEVVGHKALVAKAIVVDKRYAAYPVAVGDCALSRIVVLSASKVPHEIAPIHEIALV